MDCRTVTHDATIHHAERGLDNLVTGHSTAQYSTEGKSSREMPLLIHLSGGADYFIIFQSYYGPVSIAWATLIAA